MSKRKKYCSLKILHKKMFYLQMDGRFHIKHDEYIVSHIIANNVHTYIK